MSAHVACSNQQVTARSGGQSDGAALPYSVHANDPATIVAVKVLLGLIALAACFVPSRRAMKVDPMVALRHE